MRLASAPDAPLGTEKFLFALIDFGIAREGSAPDSRLTRLGTFVGTPEYMAPEQTLGAAGDARTDIWGITTVLYEAMAGSVPYPGHVVADVFQAIAYAPPAFPAQVPDLDGRLWSILVRGLRKQPNERHESCAALESELRSWLDYSRQRQSMSHHLLAPTARLAAAAKPSRRAPPAPAAPKRPRDP